MIGNGHEDHAYDFFRPRSHSFDVTPADWARVDGGAVSRGGASALIKEYADRTGPPIEVVLVALADGYLTAYGITATDEQKADALAV